AGDARVPIRDVDQPHLRRHLLPRYESERHAQARLGRPRGEAEMKSLYRLLRAGFHTALLFVLPWMTGAIVGLLFDVREVRETSGQFATFFSIVVVPLLFLQLAAIAVKIGREIRAQRAEGKRGPGVIIMAIDRHVRVLTPRGLGMAGASLAMVAVALSAKWAQ